MMARDTEEILYQETIPLTQWVRGLILLMLVSLAGAFVRTLLAGPSKDEQTGLLASSAVAAAVAFFGWNYRAVEIRVTRRAFLARYGLLNRTVIPISEIENCQPTRADFGRYWGIGIRMGLDGSSAYTTSFGPAVEIRRRNGRPFVVSTNKPQDLCQAVNQALAGLRA